jgi:hypothetical protein
MLHNRSTPTIAKASVNSFTLDVCESAYADNVRKPFSSNADGDHPMKTFITALAVVFALASGISMIALAFRADFRETTAHNGGDWTMWNRLG